MKKMQDFREWLFLPTQESTTVQKRLVALTRIRHADIDAVAEFQPWYIWEADKSVA